MCLYTLESVVVAAQVLGGVQTVQAQPHFPRYLVIPLGGAVCAVPGIARATHGALGMRACCVRRSSCGQGRLRTVLTVVSDAKPRENCCPDCVGEWCGMCEVHVNIPIHTLHPLPHTRTSTPFTHTRTQSVSKNRSKGKWRDREKGREAGEGEMAWRARRETCLTSRSTPTF